MRTGFRMCGHFTRTIRTRDNGHESPLEVQDPVGDLDVLDVVIEQIDEPKGPGIGGEGDHGDEHSGMGFLGVANSNHNDIPAQANESKVMSSES